MTDNPVPEQEHAPVDLTPLAGLRLDPARADALLARIEAAAAPGLARRAMGAPAPGRRTPSREVEQLLARFSWPALAAAAAAVILVLQTGTATTTDATSGATLAQSLTETDSSTHWIAEQSTPTDADLVWAIGLETGQ